MNNKANRCFYFLISALLFFNFVSSQNLASNSVCANLAPFCTGVPLTFPAVTGVTQSEIGPDYDCLSSQPNPSWFYMQILSTGPMTVVISALTDVDFICWGPFSTLNGNCGNLNTSTQIPNTSTVSNGCSYSGSPTETLIIQNAIAGQFYILLVTNFSGMTQSISMNQTNYGQPGAATTNCGVLCIVTPTNSGSICAGHSATLSAIANIGVATYTWVGPNSYTSSNITNVVSPQTTTTYTFVGTLSSSLNASPTNTCMNTTTVYVISLAPTVTANNTLVCSGFPSTLTVAGANIYWWSNSVSSSVNIVNPTLTTIYSVVATDSNQCQASATVAVSVFIPSISVSGPTAICAHESATFTGSGANSYSWSNGPTIASTKVTPTVTSTYTLSTSTTSGAVTCNSTKTIQLIVNKCTGIQELNSTSNYINLYPNPNEGTFFIESSVCLEIKVFNEIGQLVKSFKLNEHNNYKVKVSDLPSGIYFVNSIDKTQTLETRKLIICR